MVLGCTLGAPFLVTSPILESEIWVGATLLGFKTCLGVLRYLPRQAPAIKITTGEAKYQLNLKLGHMH